MMQQSTLTSGRIVTAQTIANDVEIMRESFINKLQDETERAYVRSLSTDEFIEYRQEWLIEKWGN